MQQRYVKTSSYCISNFFMESRESCLAADGRAWKVDGRAQALVDPGLATPLGSAVQLYTCTQASLKPHYIRLTVIQLHTVLSS